MRETRRRRMILSEHDPLYINFIIDHLIFAYYGIDSELANSLVDELLLIGKDAIPHLEAAKSINPRLSCKFDDVINSIKRSPASCAELQTQKKWKNQQRMSDQRKKVPHFRDMGEWFSKAPRPPYMVVIPLNKLMYISKN